VTTLNGYDVFRGIKLSTLECGKDDGTSYGIKKADFGVSFTSQQQIEQLEKRILELKENQKQEQTKEEKPKKVTKPKKKVIKGNQP
jgi:TolA-binding protein